MTNKAKRHNKPPVGWVPGHSYISPYGVNVPGFKPEYNYNRDILACAQYSAYDEGFDQYCIIDYPSSERSYQAIGPQVLEAERLQCPITLEIHLNSHDDPTTNYGVAFYKSGDETAQRFALKLCDALYPGLSVGMNLSKFMAVGLPAKNWPKLRAVMLSTIPYVLIEPFFLTSKHAQRWLQLSSSIPWLGRQIMDTSRTFLYELERNDTP